MKHMKIETRRLSITEFDMSMAESVHRDSFPVTLKDGTYIGYVQSVPFDDDTWEIGYHIDENYTNQGYATEAVTAFLPVIMKQKSWVSALQTTKQLSRLWKIADLSSGTRGLEIIKARSGKSVNLYITCLQRILW